MTKMRELAQKATPGNAGRFRTTRTDIDRFMEKVSPEPNSGCWLWIGAIRHVTGYASFWNGSDVIHGHRFSYEHFNGKIPDGATIDHLCRIRCCVNPKHLEAVPNRENILRGSGGSAANHKKTHCLKGHEFSQENTRFELTKRWGTVRRICLICYSAAYRKHNKIKKNRKLAARAALAALDALEEP